MGNPHHLLWYLLLIIKHQPWQPNNFINEPSFYWLLRSCINNAAAFLLNDDRKIAGSWNLVRNSSMMKYFKNSQNLSTRYYVFCPDITGAFSTWLLSNPSPYTFLLFPLLFLVTSFLVVAVQPCIEWIPIKNMKI